MSVSTRASQFIFVLLAIFLAMLGVVFLYSAGQTNMVVRLTIGIISFASAAGLIYLSKLRPVEHTHVHKMQLDLPGEVAMKSFECSSCGATLDHQSVKLVAGAIHVNCPYCGSSYQMEEAPKW